MTQTHTDTTINGVPYRIRATINQGAVKVENVQIKTRMGALIFFEGIAWWTMGDAFLQEAKQAVRQAEKK